MNNKLIFSDGKIIYITLESKIRNWVKWILIALNVLLYSAVILVFSSIDDRNGQSLLPPIIFLPIVIFFIVTRPTLWNIYGRESIVLTTENFTYYRDFGIYKSTPKSIKLENGIALDAETVLTYQKEEHVLITFYGFRENDEPQEILTTGIKTAKIDFDLICELISEIFEDKKMEEVDFRMN